MRPAPGGWQTGHGYNKARRRCSLKVTAPAAQPGHFSAGGRGGQFIPKEISGRRAGDVRRAFGGRR